MFKKISLLCLLSAPLFCQNQSKPQTPSNAAPGALSTLKCGLEKQENATAELATLINRHNNAIMSTLNTRLPRFPRTKVFLTGALAGSALALYIGHQYREVLQCPRARISQIQETLNQNLPQRAPSKIVDKQEPDDESENGAEVAAEEKAAQDANSCYFK